MSLIGLLAASMGTEPAVSLAAVPSPCADIVFMAAASCGITLEADGDVIIETTAGGAIDEGDWINPKAAAGAAYECRMTVNSGTVSAGTTGSWLGLGSNRAWQQNQVSAGLQTANVTLEIRKASSGVVMASATFDFSAEHTT